MIELTFVTGYVTNSKKKKNPDPWSPLVAEVFGLFVNVLIYLFGPWTQNQF